MAAVAVNNTAYIRKPDPCTLKLLIAVQASKHTEEFVSALHIKPYAIVADEEDILVPAAFTSYFDDRLGTWSRVLDRIGQ